MVTDAGSKTQIAFCKMSPQHSEYLLVGSMNSTIGLYNYKDELLKLYKGHQNNFHKIDGKFVRNETTGRNMVLAGSEDGYICGWDLNSQHLQIKVPIVDGCNVLPPADKSPERQKQSNIDLYDSPDKDENKVGFVADKTVFQVDYFAPTKTIAACGNFGQMRLMHAGQRGLQDLVDLSK